MQISPWDLACHRRDHTCNELGRMARCGQRKDFDVTTREAVPPVHWGFVPTQKALQRRHVFESLRLSVHREGE
ncbi:MAG: hypothetical protein ACO3JL_20310, partial [Myxococcota bacterium]